MSAVYLTPPDHPKLSLNPFYEVVSLSLTHTALELVQYARDGHGRQPENHRQRDVKILDVFGNAATVRLEMNDWVDYLQIAKWNGRWVIVNVLWALKET